MKTKEIIKKCLEDNGYGTESDTCIDGSEYLEVWHKTEGGFLIKIDKLEIKNEN